jgi:GNAT superfamily N-acetyltransferase
VADPWHIALRSSYSSEGSVANDDVIRELESRPLSKADYDHIVRVIDRWWDGPTSALAHPIFFYELGTLARVVEHEGRLVGFLLGFIAPEGPIGYVHLVGIDPDYRRRGVASELYGSFELACRERGCTSMKAVTTLGNEGSVEFHLAQGWKSTLVDDYAGPGRNRVVFSKPLDKAGQA